MLETEREQDNLLLRTICAGCFFWTTRETLKDLMMASPVTSTTLIKTQCLSTFNGTELLILLVIPKAYRSIHTSSLTNTKATCLSESVHLLTASSYQKTKHEVRKRKGMTTFIPYLPHKVSPGSWYLTLSFSSASPHMDLTWGQKCLN